MEAEAQAFAKQYATQWTPPSTSDDAIALGKQIASYYRPGVTFFIIGSSVRLETEDDVANLLTTEMKGAFEHGIIAGAELVMRDCHIEPCSQTSAICRITFDFKPSKNGQSAGQDFEFTNWYGYRAAGNGSKAGWEFILRDQEATQMGKAMGMGGGS